MSKFQQVRVLDAQANMIFTKFRSKSRFQPNQRHQSNKPDQLNQPNSNKFKPKGKNFKANNTRTNKPAQGPSVKFCFVCGRTKHLARDFFSLEEGALSQTLSFLQTSSSYG